MNARPSRFARWLLPGLAFKGFVIGGGYATGRELAEFFAPSGTQGGLTGLLLAALVWSVVCALTFALAQANGSYDYRSFFSKLIGRGWVAFELTWLALMVLLLAVFGAAAGAVVHAITGAPVLVGTIALMLAVGGVVAFGNASVEKLFSWASLFLYAVYFIFVVLAISAFGERIGDALATPQPRDGWFSGGVAYACYNVVGAVAILPVVRHCRSRRDALVAGVLAGPLAILPALAFFASMAAWLPDIASAELPSDYLLQRMQVPAFQFMFQAMVFSALLESSVGVVHALNQRVATTWQSRRGNELPRAWRLGIATALLVGSIFVADAFGLVSLIAHGYRALAWLILMVYVLPLLTIGAWKLRRTPVVPLDG